MVLAAFGLVAAALAVTLLPVPLWASRAMRSSSPHKALPAAGEPTVAPEHARVVAELITEINTAIDLVGRARESVADYAAAVPLAWALDRVSSDNWVRSTIRQSQYDESEAAKAIERVVHALADVPSELKAATEGAAQSLGSSLGRVGQGSADARPGRRMSRSEARRNAKLYEATVRRLIELRGAITEPARDPYRR